MSKYNLLAKLQYKDCGYDRDQNDVAKYPLGTIFEVEDIHMGQSNTRIKFVGILTLFNSVNFEFTDDNGVPVNIFKDPKWNPYLSMRAY